MTRLQVDIDIRAPIHVVFANLTDPKRGPQWNPNILDVSDLSEYPVREGTTWKQTTVVFGARIKVNCRITRFQPPDEGVLEITGLQNAELQTICSELGGVTHVTQVLDAVLPGGKLGNLAGNLFKSQLQRELTETLRRQRDVLEAGEER